MRSNLNWLKGSRVTAAEKEGETIFEIMRSAYDRNVAASYTGGCALRSEKMPVFFRFVKTRYDYQMGF